MAIIASRTEQDYPQADGRRRVKHVFTHDVVGDIMRSRTLNAGDDADADRAALETEVDQRVADKDASSEAERQKEIETEGDWDAGSVATRQQVAAAILVEAALEQDSFRAWKMFRKVVPWIIAQGFTFNQFANYLGVTVGTVQDINARWQALEAKRAQITSPPLIAEINIAGRYTRIIGDPGVIEWVKA